MRIIFYLISFILICVCFSSCTKGSIVKDPQFGNISIADLTNEKINVIQGDNKKFEANGTKSSIISGKSRFRFYLSDILLLDTLLSVEPFNTHAYTIFKSNTNAKLRIYDSGLNGLDKESLPDSGLVKFSIANFSNSLPDKVNIYISTSTYTPFSDKTIQVGQFPNVSSLFSGFQSVMVGINQSSKPVNKFILTIKDLNNQSVLSTVPLTLPVGTTAGNIGQLTGSVYLLYISDKGVASILMSK